MNSPAPLVVTAGEPAGIGPELCLALADQCQDLVVVGDPTVLRERAEAIGSNVEVVEVSDASLTRTGSDQLAVLPIVFPQPVTPGQLDTANAATLLDGLRLAVSGCQSGRFSAMITAPLQKSIINDAGIPFSGHTEFLAELTGSPTPVMLLVAGDLRVALATTHLPLRDVPDALTRDGIREVLRVLRSGLRERFRLTNPRILVCGLNPHAGEGGHLGSEDSNVIEPVINELQAAGWNIGGPLPADTVFTPNAGPKDAVLAMYHDQGLPVLKFAGFGNAVNVTLGLPIVRTSVDHGTALNLAGTGTADAGSMLEAVRLAAQMARA